ncbi:MAG: hypothetical protein F6K30_11755 [Cyanothece sp. SIO2G6]|nr:hypothetical protein [Cyanothece sp. SIO2G6]
MMAILNRRQELPRDRADLYDQASRVLLYHWDVDHKRLQLPLDAIGRREKQEMLRLIAYEMQAGEDGLKGNLISAERLTRILTDYLINQGFSEPREKASRLIQQLRERNFILCYRGADTYGFMHRTFLEYFCAVEIVHRFEKQRTLTFEKLRDDIFGQHWQDDTWHESLRLVCGMIEPLLAGKLVEYLMHQEIERSHFLEQKPWGQMRLKSEALCNLLLAADCMSEINHVIGVIDIRSRLLSALQHEVENWEMRLSWILCEELLSRITTYFDDTLPWLKTQAENNTSSFIQYTAVMEIAKHYSFNEETKYWFKDWAKNAEDWGAQAAAVEVLDKFYYEDEETELLPFLMQLVRDSDDWGVRNIAAKLIRTKFIHSKGVCAFLLNVVASDPFIRIHPEQDNPRKTALAALLSHYNHESEVLELLSDRATNDPDPQLREWAQKQLQQMENRGGSS